VLSDPAFGAVCALGAALAWSVTSLLARTLMPHYGSVTINAVRSGIAGWLLLVCVVLTDGPGVLVSMSATTFLVLVVSIVAAIGIGDSVFFESTRAIGLGRAMTIATTYPIGAALMASAFYGERITTAIATGTLLTLGGVALIVSVRTEARPERAPTRMPAMLSTNAVPDDVPARPAPNVAHASTIRPRRRLSGRPSGSVSPAALATPMNVDRESKRSVNRIATMAGSSDQRSASTTSSLRKTEEKSGWLVRCSGGVA